MKHKVVCTVVVSLFLLSTMLMPTIQEVKAEDTTALHVDPSKSCAPVGELFSINASIFNVTNLNTWRFDLEWNS
jgi:hypothetical protein